MCTGKRIAAPSASPEADVEELLLEREKMASYDFDDEQPLLKRKSRGTMPAATATPQGDVVIALRVWMQR